MDLPRVISSTRLRYGDRGEAAESADDLEELGFEALWVPDVGGPVMDSVAHLLASTKQAVIATGILNLWMHEPSEVAAEHAALTAQHGDRFLLGIGITHAPLIDSNPAANASRSLPRAPSSMPWTPPSSPFPSAVTCWPRSDRRCWSWPRPAPAVPTFISSRPTTPVKLVQHWATVPYSRPNRPFC